MEMRRRIVGRITNRYRMSGFGYSTSATLPERADHDLLGIYTDGSP